MADDDLELFRNKIASRKQEPKEDYEDFYNAFLHGSGDGLSAQEMGDQLINGLGPDRLDALNKMLLSRMKQSATNPDPRLADPDFKDLEGQFRDSFIQAIRRNRNRP